MIDYNDIGEKNGDGEEVRNTNFSIRVTKRMGRPLRAYLAYYSEREEDLSLADPETVMIKKEEAMEAIKRLMKKLDLDDTDVQNSIVAAAYLTGGMSKVLELFVKVIPFREKVIHFSEKLVCELSEGNGGYGWLEVSVKARESFCKKASNRVGGFKKLAEIIWGSFMAEVYLKPNPNPA